MSRLESIYLRLPSTLQNLVVSLEGGRVMRRRYGGGYEKVLRHVQDQGQLDPVALAQWRRHRLAAFLQTAYASPFWQARFGKHQVNPRGANPFEELAKLPVLTKDEVKRNVAAIINPTVDRRSLVWRHTSGTTGSGLIFPETRETEWWTWAHWWRYRRWHGIDPSMWCGYFGGRSLVPVHDSQPPFWRINRPGRQVMFSGYHLSHRTVGAYLEALREYRVQWIHGYPSMLTLLAQLIVDDGLKVDLPGLRIVTTGAENLSDWQRLAIRRAFGVPVFQHYGQAEAAANISECEHGRMHVDEDFAAVEFVENIHDSVSRRIIGTNWLNESFPLLRYETGDLAVLAEGQCPCGRSGRLVASIDGRQEDYLVLPNDVRVGRLDHIFKDMVNVREAQFIQDQSDSVTLRIARNQAYTDADEQLLRAEMRRRIGDSLKLSIEYMDTIPRGPNGKLRLVISSIA